MIIDISIINKRPAVYGAPRIVCGNSGYNIQFTFDQEWANYTVKTARFVYAQGGQAKYQDVVFTGESVEVPVLSNVREVLVGVYSGDLKTTTPARILCEQSILCSDPVHEEPPEDVYNQLISLIIAGGGGGSGGDVDVSNLQTDETLKIENGILSVNTTNRTEQDNTLPITSAGVYEVVGNIEALLKTI